MVSIVETNEETTMQPWRPGVCLLTEFDIKIGKLSFSVRKDVLTRNHIAEAIMAADQAIVEIIRGKTNARSADRRKIPKRQRD
jgi:hypothetical protein